MMLLSHILPDPDLIHDRPSFSETSCPSYSGTYPYSPLFLLPCIGYLVQNRRNSFVIPDYFGPGTSDPPSPIQSRLSPTLQLCKLKGSTKCNTRRGGSAAPVSVNSSGIDQGIQYFFQKLCPALIARHCLQILHAAWSVFSQHG